MNEDVKKQEKANPSKLAITLIIIGFAVVIAFGTFVYSEMQDIMKVNQNAEWVCIAEECSKQISGQEWVDKNCRWVEGQTLCNINYEGQVIQLPIENIVVENMKECVEYKCKAEVLLRNVP